MCDGKLIKGSDIVMKESFKIKTCDHGRLFIGGVYKLATDTETGDYYKVIKTDGISIMVPCKYNFYYSADIPEVNISDIENINGNIYNHFKNKKYMGITKAYNIIDKKWYYIYMALYDNYDIYAREEKMFESDKSEGYSNKEYPQKERFRLIGNFKNYLDLLKKQS